MAWAMALPAAILAAGVCPWALFAIVLDIPVPWGLAAPFADRQ